MKDNTGYFDGTCKIKISWPIYLFFKLLKYILYGIWWLWVNLLRDPLAQLLASMLGEYYVYVEKILGLIIKFYKLIIKYTFKIINICLKIIYNVIDIIFRILFRILPTILKDILAYILAVPFLIFSPLYEYFPGGVGKYFAVICWSEDGLVSDVKSFFSFLTVPDLNELEKSASFEEDVEKIEKNRKKDIDNSSEELIDDGEEIKDDADNF